MSEQIVSEVSQAIRKASQGKERRAWLRYPATPSTPNISVFAEEEVISWNAEVSDVSQGGISLLANSEFMTGALVEIELPDGKGGIARTLQARVVRSETKDGVQWLIGCAFFGILSECEVQALLE